MPGPLHSSGLAEELFYRHLHCLHRLLSGFLSLIFLQSFLLEYPSFFSFHDEIVCLLFGHLALLSTFQFSQCCIHKVAFIYLAISTYIPHMFLHTLSRPICRIPETCMSNIITIDRLSGFF